MDSVIKEATSFIAACYGRKSHESMSVVRYEVLVAKTGRKGIKKIPELKTLPPTSESFAENVKRVHLQTAIWKSAEEQSPPDLDPTLFGWTKEPTTGSLKTDHSS